MREFHDNNGQVPILEELLPAIDLCLEGKRFIAALLLLYSGVDSLGWLYAKDESERPGRRFTKFVDRFLLPGSKLNCNSADLWAARCAVLHTMTADSDLSRD